MDPTTWVEGKAIVGLQIFMLTKLLLSLDMEMHMVHKSNYDGTEQFAVVSKLFNVTQVKRRDGVKKTFLCGHACKMLLPSASTEKRFMTETDIHVISFRMV